MRRPIRRGAGPAPLTPEQREFLRTGRHPSRVIGIGATPERRARLRRLWAEHAPTVTAEWVEESPWTRPWAWWAFGLNLAPQVGLEADSTPRQARYARRYSGTRCVPSPAAQRRYLRRFELPHPAEQAASGLPCDT
jgi:hypothetical protein